LARHGTPEIFNTDQGSRLTSRDWIDVSTDAVIKIGMDGKGGWPASRFLLGNHCRATDNRMIEWLWRSLNCEWVYLHTFERGSEEKADIGRVAGLL